PGPAGAACSACLPPPGAATRRRAGLAAGSATSAGSMMLAKKIGIDLGTSTVLVYVKGEGIVINEPSLVALNRDGNKILAVGRQAFEMVGRTPETINIVRPMREGVIADFVVTEGMLHYFIARVQGRQRIFKPEVMICVPSGVTSVERRAVTEAAISAGAKQ